MAAFAGGGAARALRRREAGAAFVDLTVAVVVEPVAETGRTLVRVRAHGVRRARTRPPDAVDAALAPLAAHAHAGAARAHVAVAARTRRLRVVGRPVAVAVLVVAEARRRLDAAHTGRPSAVDAGLRPLAARTDRRRPAVARLALLALAG